MQAAATTLEIRALLDRAIEAEDSVWPTKRKIYEEIAMALVNSGVPHQEVSATGRRMLEERLWETRLKPKGIPREEASINRSHWYAVMSEFGYTSRSATPESGVEDTSPSDHPVTTVPEENRALLDTLEDARSRLGALCTLLRSGPFCSGIDRALLDEQGGRLRAQVDNWGDYLSNKQAVPRHAQALFLKLTGTAGTISHIFGLFYDEMHRIHEEARIMTSKELKKLKAREVVGLDLILEPQSENEAILNGYYGQACASCKGFRTRIHPDDSRLIECFRCRGRSGIPSQKRIPLIQCQTCRMIVSGQRHAEFIRRKSLCPHCRAEMTLPEELR